MGRASWRTLAGGFDDADEELLKKYKGLVEDELETICMEVLSLLTEHLCKNVEGNGDETEVFYLKMCGDYYRYLSEFKTEPEDKAKEIKSKAEEFYKKAMDVAEANLNETHPTRLGLALNFSVCYYEILKKKKEACDLAKKAFDAAIEKLDTLNDASYKDSTLIMQLLRDNLTLWTSEGQDQEPTNEADPQNQVVGIVKTPVDDHCPTYSTNFDPTKTLRCSKRVDRHRHFKY